MRINSTKYFVFILLILLLSTSNGIYNNLSTGYCSRFEGGWAGNAIGKAYSGFFTNLIMFVDVLGNKSLKNNQIFQFYLVFGTIFNAFAYVLFNKFHARQSAIEAQESDEYFQLTENKNIDRSS